MNSIMTFREDCLTRENLKFFFSNSNCEDFARLLNCWFTLGEFDCTLLTHWFPSCQCTSDNPLGWEFEEKMNRLGLKYTNLNNAKKLKGKSHFRYNVLPRLERRRNAIANQILIDLTNRGSTLYEEVLLHCFSVLNKRDTSPNV